MLGDGAVAMGLGELATLARHELPITVVVLRNHALALEVWEQTALQGNPQYGCEVPPIRFADAARACGVAGWSVEDPAEVRGALAAALAHDGPALVEIVVDALEAPFGETLTPEQAGHIATALDRGEPAAGPIARNLLEPGRRAVARKLAQDTPSIDTDGELAGQDEPGIFAHYRLPFGQVAGGARRLARR